jgi:hypothetical protein
LWIGKGSNPQNNDFHPANFLRNWSPNQGSKLPNNRASAQLLAAKARIDTDLAPVTRKIPLLFPAQVLKIR